MAITRANDARDQSVISRHINNVFKEEVDKTTNMQKLHIANSDKPVSFYSKDTLIRLIMNMLSRDEL